MAMETVKHVLFENEVQYRSAIRIEKEFIHFVSDFIYL